MKKATQIIEAIFSAHIRSNGINRQSYGSHYIMGTGNYDCSSYDDVSAVS